MRVQQIEKEKVAKTKMRMLMIENEQLQSSLRIRKGTDTSTYCIFKYIAHYRSKRCTGRH